MIDHSRFHPTRWWLSLLLLTLLVHGSSVTHGFHYDDRHSIVENRHLRSLARVPTFLVNPQAFSADPQVAMYRPLLLATYALNYTLGGLAPWGYHLVNILLHAAMVLLVFRVVSELARSRISGWWVAAVFALHPINTEAVNYICSRSEVLFAVLALAAFHLAETAQPRHRRWGLVCYALSLMAKSAAVVLPGLLALTEWTRPRERRQWRSLAGYWVVTALYFAIIVGNRFLTESLGHLVRPLHVQIFTQIKALVYYLKLLVLPVGLSVEHAFSPSQSLWSPAVLLSGLAIGSLVLVVWRGRGHRLAKHGVLWFFAGLGLTFAMSLNVLVNEHRPYLSLVGFLLALVTVVRARPWGAVRGVGIATLALLAVLSVERSRVWADDLALWQDASSKAPLAFRVHANLGEALYEAGELEGAGLSFARALELNEELAPSWNNLGVVWEELGKLDAARQAYRRALEVHPELADALKNLGRLQLRAGNLEEAEELLSRSRRADPFLIQTRVNLAYLYLKTGRRSLARTEVDAALELDAENPMARTNLGILYQEEADDAPDAATSRRLLRQSIAECKRALAADSTHAEALINIAGAYARLDSSVAARAAYERAEQCHPGNRDLLLAFAQYEAGEGQYRRVVALLERGLALGEDADALVDLGNAQVAMGQFELAAQAYRRSTRLDSSRLSTRYNLAEVLVEAGRRKAAAGDGRGAVQAWGEARQMYRWVAATAPAYRRTPERLQWLAGRLR